MTIEYQDQNGQANGSGNGQSGGASAANNGPTSAPHNITNHNIDIANPFQQQGTTKSLRALASNSKLANLG